MVKYATMRWEIRHQFPDYRITQYNMMVDVLGGYLRETTENMRELLGKQRRDQVLLSMQKSIIIRIELPGNDSCRPFFVVLAESFFRLVSFTFISLCVKLYIEICKLPVQGFVTQ